MNARRWQDWVMLILGAWLFFSPFWMAGYASYASAAAWNSYVFGVAVALFAVIALAAPARWEEWVEVAIGIWLVISPFVLGYRAGEIGAAWNAIVIGALVIIDGYWAASLARTQVTAPR